MPADSITRAWQAIALQVWRRIPDLLPRNYRMLMERRLRKKLRCKGLLSLIRAANSTSIRRATYESHDNTLIVLVINVHRGGQGAPDLLCGMGTTTRGLVTTLATVLGVRNLPLGNRSQHPQASHFRDRLKFRLAPRQNDLPIPLGLTRSFCLFGMHYQGGQRVLGSANRIRM